MKMTKDIKQIAEEYSKKDSMIDSGNLFWALTEAIKIIEELEQKNEWQPIETAPRDGTLILVTGSRYMDEHLPNISITKWISKIEERWELVTRTRQELIKVDESHWDYDCGIFPTHWMPLPKPPISEDDKALIYNSSNN